jgi:non-ribosomal peptide synthetase component F
MPAPRIPTFVQSDERLCIDEVLTEQVFALVVKKRLTLYTLTATALALLFHRYTGRCSFAVRASFANRTLPGTEAVMGWFVNSHILGIDFSVEETVSDLLDKVRTRVFGAVSHQEMPATLVCHLLGQKPSLGDLGLILSVRKEMSDSPESSDRSAGLRVRPAALSHIRDLKSANRLRVNVVQQPKTIVLEAVYPIDRFDRPTIRRLLESLKGILIEIISNPERMVGAISL